MDAGDSEAAKTENVHKNSAADENENCDSEAA